MSIPIQEHIELMGHPLVVSLFASRVRYPAILQAGMTYLQTISFIFTEILTDRFTLFDLQYSILNPDVCNADARG